MASAFLCLQLAQTTNFGPGVAATGTGSSAVATHLQCVKSLAGDEAERLRRRVLPNVHFCMNSVDKASQTAASPPQWLGNIRTPHVLRARASGLPAGRLIGGGRQCAGDPTHQRPAPPGVTGARQLDAHR